MKKRILVIAAMMVLCFGLFGCLETEQPISEDEPATPIPDMKVVCDGSFTATVIAKEDDGITLEVTNSENMNKVSATFTSAKISGKEYPISQTTFQDSPLSITRAGYDGKVMNLSLTANDFARIKVSSSELHSSGDYNNVDLTYSETYMGDNGTITKTGKTISVKNA